MHIFSSFLVGWLRGMSSDLPLCLASTNMVVTMSDPMSHEFILQVPHFCEELDRLGQGSFHSDGCTVHDDLYEWPVTMHSEKPPSRCLCPVIILCYSTHTGVLFQAVSDDLVSKVRLSCSCQWNLQLSHW